MILNYIYFYSIKNKKISVPSTISEGEFEFNLQIIIGSSSYKELIGEYFFKEYYSKNICMEEEYKLDIKYSIIRCTKKNFEINIKKFPSLFLFNKGFQNAFELSYEDLFISLGEYIYFLIIFRKEGLYQYKQTWKLGIPFLKRHQIIFNSDTKRIGYYIKNKLMINDKKDNKSETNKGKKINDFFNIILKAISLRSLIEIIILILFLIILFYFSKKLYYYKNKQKKPYELQDEDYDYFSNISYNLKKEKDNCDINNNPKDNYRLNNQIIEMKSH